jgi:hypothetical protein
MLAGGLKIAKVASRSTGVGIARTVKIVANESVNIDVGRRREAQVFQKRLRKVECTIVGSADGRAVCCFVSIRLGGQLARQFDEIVAVH